MKSHPLALVLGLSAVLLVPFITRPVFVDDHAHFGEALTLPHHWANPYAAVPKMLAWQPHQGPEEANPPLYFYGMAAWTQMVGQEVWKAHLLIFLLTLAGVAAFYFIAEPYVRYPAWTSLLWLTTTHVWLTANSLLIDSLVAPLILIGLAFWISGWRSSHWLKMILGAFFLGLAALAKYTGVIGIGLAIAWVIFEARDKRSLKSLSLLLPVVLFVAWLVWSHHLYGESHFAAVAATKMNWPSLPHWITLMSFTSATTPMICLAAFVFLARGPKTLRIASWCMTISLTAFGLTSGFKPSVGLQLGFWTAMLAVWLLAITPEENSWWKADAFLLAWGVGALVEIAVAIRWVCGRFLVVGSPAWVLLSVRALERRCPDALESVRVRAGILLVTIAFSGSLAFSDWQQARAEKSAATMAEAWRMQNSPNSVGYYPGATLGGLSFYLSDDHWKGLSSGVPVPPTGIVLLPTHTLPRIFWPRIRNPKILAQWPYRCWLPLRTLDSLNGAGYYGSIWGPLPFSWSTHAEEIFVLVQTQ